ncbi:WD40-repeat-containing domain protein [Bombardia bombarda]|uniref:WD40-repeat-containing domain protein n=1 Tax=Bombardia bombarda TaxID=252184 RepID=A0AA39X7C1_9PEZI|nr:WD40-repeat-containing domain protein [Bombardia bombarda]
MYDWYQSLRGEVDDDDDREYVNEDEDEEEEEEEEEEDEADDDDDDEVLDAEGGGIELEVVLEELVGDRDNQDDEGEAAGGADELIFGVIGNQTDPRLIAHRQLVAYLRNHGPAVFEFDEYDTSMWYSRRRRDYENPNRFPKVPSEEGRKLMESGVFGAFDTREPDRKGLARRILDRELGLGGKSGRKTNQGLMAQQMIPSTNPEMVIHFDDPVCCGQFSDDGNFFYACVKDYRVRMYDTSNPYDWKHYKTVNYPFGQWTLTDAALSPDNKWLAYTSLRSSVCFAPTNPNDTGDPYSLDLADYPRQAGRRFRGDFSIFSVRFSGDGRHLVAGTSTNSIVVYDIERRQSLHHVVAHYGDVNAVCFADKMSPHILYSGSDDCTIRVWDTRSIGDNREAGAFIGHIEGITYIDSKGDGRYILSNGKDQSMKLWDLRMAMSLARYEELDPMRETRTRPYVYDYRRDSYRENRWFPHPNDNSLVTFRGHKVQRTLIRCHFSPPGSTNSRYVYSGSADGFVHVWNLDATLAAKINIKSVTEGIQPGVPRDRMHYGGPNRDWQTVVRDVGWHPNTPMFVASAWNGPNMDAGTASVHSFNENEVDEAEPKMGRSVNERLMPENLSIR